jgi:predicted DNA-binding helix-hairpin-helix protein
MDQLLKYVPFRHEAQTCTKSHHTASDACFVNLFSYSRHLSPALCMAFCCFHPVGACFGLLKISMINCTYSGGQCYESSQKDLLQAELSRDNEVCVGSLNQYLENALAARIPQPNGIC